MFKDTVANNKIHSEQAKQALQDEGKHPLRGHIFVCTTKTKLECFQRSLFGSSKAYGASVLKMKKGDILFLRNVSDDTISGIYKAASDGGINIEPNAWQGKYKFQIRFENEINVLELGNATRIMKKLNYNDNTILIGEQLAYLVDLFAYKAASLECFHIKRNIGSQVNADSATLDDVPYLEPTTLWSFSRQSYGSTPKGDSKYPGVTPALVIYNLIWRYTEPGDLVVDPMCGSGTTIDVCKEETRRVRGFDVSPIRDDIEEADARSLPIDSSTVDLVFIDSPYGDNIDYNEDPNNLGKMSSDNNKFYDELEKIMVESKRILKDGKTIAWLISDQWEKDIFTAVGLKIYERLCRYFKPVDIVCVVRRGQSSHTGEWVNRSRRLNFYLRGFKYLFILKKAPLK